MIFSRLFELCATDLGANIGPVVVAEALLPSVVIDDSLDLLPRRVNGYPMPSFPTIPVLLLRCHQDHIEISRTGHFKIPAEPIIFPQPPLDHAATVDAHPFARRVVHRR